MNKFKNSIVCICLLLACFSAKAIKLPPFEQFRLLSTLTNGQYFNVDDGLRTTLTPPASGWNQGYCFNAAQGRVILEVANNGGTCPPSSFTCSVTVRAEYVGTSNTIQTEEFVLSVNYNASTGISYKEKDIKILTHKANCIKITLLGRTVSDNNALGFLYLRGEIEEDRQQCEMSLLAPTFTLTKNLTTNQIEVNIDPSLSKHAEEYDLEWTFIDEYDAASIHGATRIFDFRNNATRVTIKEATYKVSNVFEAGYVVFRVRIVGYYKELVDGKECERRVTGAWSHTSSVSLADDKGLLSENVGAYFEINTSGSTTSIPPHETGLNWQYAASFAEEGKKNETTSYFDGTLRQRQTVVKNENDATSIIQETIYDFEGRPAITTLPVPVKAGVLNFYPNFNRNPSGLPYSAIDFDVNNVNSCVGSVAPMLNTSGAEKYYSTQNEFTSANTSATAIPIAENYVPIANGYPFVQVEFLNDQTGRVRAQSAPGAEYTVGGVETHETKYYYAIPGGNELYELFGSEAGDHKHYSKQTVVDANGQGSVSYMNMSGKVVATALVGNNAADPDGTDKTEDFISQDEDPRIEDGAIILTTSINVTKAGVHKFKYEVTPQKYNVFSCSSAVNPPPLCYDCIYDLVISIKNTCGQEQLHGEGPDDSEPFVLIKRPIGGNPIGGPDEEINKCYDPTTYTFELDGKLNSYVDAEDGFLMINLAPGTYSLIKTLTVRESIVDDYVKDFLAQPQCKTLEAYKKKAWDDIDKTGCEMTCEQCTQELNQPRYDSEEAFIAYKENQLTSAGVNINDISDETRSDWGKLYKDLKTRCDNICGVPKPCEVYRGMMVADITPGGQYASFAYKESLVDPIHTMDGTIEPVLRYNTAHTEHSINVFAPYHSTTNRIGYNGVFTSADKIFVNGVEREIPSLSPTEFLEEWNNHQDEWIARLLPLHPEYCELEWCQVTEATRIYDEEMMNIDTYDEAVTKGFLKLTYEMDPTGTNGIGDNGYSLGVIVPYRMPGGINDNLIKNWIDPLFDVSRSPHVVPSTAPNSMFRNFWDRIMNYKTVEGTGTTTTLSLWDLPVYQTFCDNIDLSNTSAINACIASNRNNIMNCQAYRNYYWQTIRALYNSEKIKLLNELRISYNLEHDIICPPFINTAVAERRFITMADFDAITANTGTSAVNIETQIENHCADQCEAYKPMWREALKGCNPDLQVGGVGEQILEQILDEMVEVCKRGCDAGNPLGASTVSPENYDETLPNSFEDVLKGQHFVNINNQMTIVPPYYSVGICDDILIKMPKPYGHDYFATSSPEANKCACNPSIYSYDPNCPCSNAAAAADVNATIIQMRTDVAEDKKCKNCIDCPTFAIYYKMYINKYDSFNETSSTQQFQLVNFLNQQTGFNLVFDDYKEHVIKCTGLESTHPTPFVQFQRIHIDPITTSAGLNNEIPSGNPSYANDPSLPYASKVVNDCTGFLETVNEFMAGNSAAYLHTNIAANDINIYNWIEYHDVNNTGVLTDLITALNLEFGAALFDKRGLIEQFRVCLPLDCKDFEARWFLYHYPIQEGIVRRNMLMEPYYPTTLGTDVTILNNRTILEVNTDDLWSLDLNPLSEQNYPEYGVVPKFTSQTVLQYTDMCRKYCCGGSLNETLIPSEGYENFDNVNITDPTRLDLMLHSLFEPVDGHPYCTIEGPRYIAPSLLEQLKFKYKYPQTVIYTKVPLTNNNVLIGAITGMQAPKFDIKMETVLLYSEKYGTISNPSAIPGPKSSYIPVNPAADFSFDKVEDYKFISSASYHYTESQYIYKLWYRPSPGLDLKVQYVLLTVSTYPFMEELIYQTSCFPQNTLCNRPLFEATVPYESECQKRLKIIADANGLKNWNDYIRNIEIDFRRNYLAKCFGAASTESFQHKYTSFEHHYTLYYYDQAQNLVKTVPPAGVILRTDLDAIKTALSNNVYATPISPNVQHTKATVYAYNSLNQLVWQQTPDAEGSNFYYDEVGRLVLSQNAKQLDASTAKKIYSYTLYDNLSRIKEVGQLYSVATVVSDVTQNIYPYTDLETLMGNTSNTTTTDVTKTYYDNPIPYSVSLFPYKQENTRNRVTKVTSHPSGAGATQSQAVYYTYDVVGNVKQLVRQVNSLSTGYFDEEFKTVDYEYDIVSGKVNRVVYQAGETDQYIHSYTYDKLNRLTKVASGYRMETLDKDATYQYYKHGPLSRVTLGSQSVQGVDYAYTLQGWLKGVNSGSLQAQHDMGHDGFIPTVGGQTNANQLTAKDEFGFILQYFSGDYSAAGGTGYNQFMPVTAGSALGSASGNLYNGNIKMMTTAIKKLMPDGKPLATAYDYDNLNRITTATYYNNYNTSDNTWSSATGSELPDYLNTFTYDADGNIQNQVRNGSQQKGVAMDNLTYHYIDGTNKLESVEETVDDVNYMDDIDNTGWYYSYDKIGNLEKDLSEQIANIQWNVYGKIKRITRTEESIKPDLEFEYTPDGYRSVKVVIPKTPGSLRTYTYYVRDAQGNIMATYVRKYNKTIDFNSLTYAEVNSKIKTTLGLGGFATFLANLDASNTALLTNVHNNIKLLSAGNKEDLVKSAGDVISILQENHSFLREYIGNCNPSDLGLALAQISSGSNCPTNPGYFINGANKQMTDCMIYNNYQPQGTSMIKHLIRWMPDMTEAYLRYMYVYDNHTYIDFASQLNLTTWDLDQDMLDMRANFNGNINENVFGPSPTYSEDLVNYSNDESALNAYGTMLAQYYKSYLEIASQTGAQAEDLITCIEGISLLFDAYGMHYSLEPNAAWDVMLHADAAVYQDPYLPTMTGSNSNYYLDKIKSENTDSYFSMITNSSYVNYIDNAQQTHPYYCPVTAGNGIKEYLDYLKAINGQLAYDAVVKSFFNNSTSYTDKITLTEHHIYGSSRLGVRKVKRTLALAMYRSSYTIDGVPQDNNTVTPVMYSFANMATVDTCRIIRGEKNYELSNHLGNVLAVVSDKKRWNCTGNYYEADVQQANDYSPFGAPLPDRSWNPRIVLNDQFNTTTDGWAGIGATLSNDNSRLKIVSSSASSYLQKSSLKTEIGKLYEVYLDVTLGTFTGMTVTIHDNNGADLNTTTTLSTAGGKQLVYFRAASNNVRITLTPTGGSAKTGYVNFIEVKQTTEVKYTQHVTKGVAVIVDSRAGSPTTYNAKSSIIFENGFESGTTDNFETFIESGLPEPIYGYEEEDEDYRFGFNGKEMDDETYGDGNAYDFGARIYDPRLGRWLSVDPLQRIYPSQSPYNYAANSPILYIDRDGKKVFIYGADAEQAKCELQKTTSLQLTYDSKTHQLTATGIPQNDYDKALLAATSDPNVNVNLYTTKAVGYTSKDGTVHPITIGAYEGSEVVNSSDKGDFLANVASGGLASSSNNEKYGKTTVETTQIINLDQALDVEKNGGEQAGRAVGHEILESYSGGVNSPGGDYNSSYPAAHKAALTADPIAASNKDEGVTNFLPRSGVTEFGYSIKNTNTYLRLSDEKQVKKDQFIKEKN